MSIEEEKETNEEESYFKKNDAKKEKKDKKFIIFSILILISILIGITAIFSREKNSNISAVKTIRIGSNLTKSMPVSAREGIAIIDLNGVISHEKRTSNFGIEMKSVTESLMDDFEYYMKDDNVKAIVLQVDSPGGALTSCEEALKYLKDLKEKYPKPIIASFRSMAASGGYYISMIADKIYANESTLTGSIGVISQFINLSGLMDKYGVKMYTVKSGRNKDSLSPFREPREDELEYWQNMTREFVEQFINVVEESRGDKIKGNRDEIFDGRVFSGKMALEIGLIDSIGTLQDAIKDAAKTGGIEDEEPYIIEKPEEKENLLNLLLSNVSAKIKIKSVIPYYEEIMSAKYIGIPMYIYIPNYAGEN
ncbi:signal peptide peptidase SppA [Brachyspira sp.]|uniref:signal peptide peptidase SppA n=1 Tax=Brachyspira sp. TaxID=1977261 RepID=UPI003D7CC264